MALIIGTPGDDDLSSANTGDVIQGLGGNDVLAANAANITLDGGQGDDQLFSFTGDATLIGGPGDDLMIGSGINDTVSFASDPAGVTVDLLNMSANDGTGGFDTLLGISNVTGSASNDSLTGDDFSNVLQGGAGDDTLKGNDGADVFKFSFNLTPGGGGGETFKFTDWLSQKHGRDFGDELPDYSPKHHHKHDKHDKHDRDGHHGKNDHHDKHHGKDDGHHSKHGDHDHHHHHHHHNYCGDEGRPAQHGGLTEKFFEKNYSEWLKEVVVPDLLAQGFELDANGNGKIKIDINEDSRNGTPRIEGLTKDQLAEMFGDRDGVILNDGGKAEKAFYSNSYTSKSGGQDTAVASGDGKDTILDFTWGEDQLAFNGLAGLTLDQFTGFFDVTEADVNGDGIPDTVLSVADHSWEVTLLSVSGHTEADFYATSVFS